MANKRRCLLPIRNRHILPIYTQYCLQAMYISPGWPDTSVHTAHGTFTVQVKCWSHSPAADPPVAASCRRLPSVAVSCRRLPPVAAGCRQLPSVATGCRRLPSVATGCRRLPPVVAGCRQLPSVAAGCRRLPGAVTFRAALVHRTLSVLCNPTCKPNTNTLAIPLIKPVVSEPMWSGFNLLLGVETGRKFCRMIGSSISGSAKTATGKKLATFPRRKPER